MLASEVVMFSANCLRLFAPVKAANKRSASFLSLEKN
jgi:hypothetical protein